ADPSSIGAGNQPDFANFNLRSVDIRRDSIRLDEDCLDSRQRNEAVSPCLLRVLLEYRYRLLLAYVGRKLAGAVYGSQQTNSSGLRKERLMQSLFELLLIQFQSRVH